MTGRPAAQPPWVPVIVAAALRAGCRTPYSEDLQDGQSIDGRLVVRNPCVARPTGAEERASDP